MNIGSKQSTSIDETKVNQSSVVERTRDSQKNKLMLSNLIDQSIHFGTAEASTSGPRTVKNALLDSKDDLTGQNGSIESTENRRGDGWFQAQGSPRDYSDVHRLQQSGSLNSTEQAAMSQSKFERRLRRFGKINQADTDQLVQIFQETKDDPDWFIESLIYKLYSERIPISEFLGLISSDDSWSHMASAKQMHELHKLFDKVYGYTKSLSRRQEQNKRYQKRLQQIKNKEVHKKDGSKGVLNELFDVNKFMGDKDMVERYAAHLNKVMLMGQHKFVQERHQVWVRQGAQEAKQLNFYERMKIDSMMRKKKAK